MMLKPYNPFAPVEWSEEMINLLKELRASKHSILTCAAQIGVCPETCARKMRELGMSTEKMNRGRTKGIHVRS